MKLSGTVRPVRVDRGSKHEHTAYRIILADGQGVAVYHAGDNPFQNEQFAPLAGRTVEVTGDFDDVRRDLFIVQEVRELR